MSETPRMDTFQRRTETSDRSIGGAYVETLAFARKLERELTVLRAVAKAAEAYNAEANYGYREVSRALAAAKEQGVEL